MKKKTLSGLILLLIFSIISIFILIDNQTIPLKIDDQVYSLMTEVSGNNFLVGTAKFLSLMASYIVIIPIAILLLFLDFKNNKYIIIALAISLLLTLLLKVTINRERPPEMTRLVDIHSKSFPSGHSLNGFVFYIAISYRYRDKLYIAIPAIILTPLIGLSRLILNVHWFSDVIAGFLLALAILLLILSIKEQQTKGELILASSSPRRKELLEKAGFEFKIEKANINEQSKETDQLKYVKTISFKKANKIIRNNKEAIVISADTIVVLNNKRYQKEKSFLKALNNLLELNGKTHEVITCVTIYKNKKYEQITKTSYVTFKDNSLKEIMTYLAKNTYQDKAGSYGIQDEHNNLILKYEGSYNNIIGLPIEEVKEVLNSEF